MRDYGTIKVSVIIYVKDTVDYIEQCISGVRNQTLQEMEILVIDGGSTDGTKEIIGRMKGQDVRIRTFDAAASVGAQLNIGLQEAKGEYIGICEADDYIPPDMYEKQYRIAKEHNLDVIRAGYYQVCNVGGREYRFEHKACWNQEKTDQVVGNDGFFFLQETVNGFWSGLYKRKFLMDHNIRMNETKGAAHQDITFSFLTQMYAERIWFMKEAFYCYRIDNSEASAYSLRGIELHIGEYEALKEQLVLRGLWEKYKTIFFSWELLSYRWFLKRLPGEIREREIGRVYCYLQKQIKENEYYLPDVMNTVQGLAETFLKDEAEFSDAVLQGIENSEKIFAYITSSFLEENRILLFGMGQIGKILKYFFELHQKEIVLLDNNSKLQDTGFMGQRVYHPAEAVRNYPDERIVIASAVHSREMENQLLGLGVQRTRILICDDEEFLLREIFAKAVAHGKAQYR